MLIDAKTTRAVLPKHTDPICPRCDLAFYGLAQRYSVTGVDATKLEILSAMVEDDYLKVKRIREDGEAVYVAGNRITKSFGSR